jgi:hypothetical protein
VSYVALLTLTSLPVSAGDSHWERYRPSKQEKAALESISTNSLKANLGFLASDLLEGRGTPSRGLDIAAEFIAAQFQRAGLEPAGDDRYFQTADWVPRRGPPGEGPPAKVRNVVGLLRGSDPAFANTYILVTAHYDHLGMKADGDDRIFNGANDDGSGVVSVLELAQVLGAMKKRPKRSIVFMTFYGEEHGLIGSHYYGAHPLFPIDKTVANINIEQVGRTDDSDNPGSGLAQVTGMDYSEVGKILEIAGKAQGVRVFKHERNSDPFFSQSDNRALADLGIPAHTFSNSYFFPDAHKVGDHADRIDYENMTRLDRVVAMAVLMIANNKNEPQWDAGNPKAEKYASARRR